MKQKQPPIFFIHIPKTAGTSFREAAIKRWGKRRVWSDYGDSQYTSHAVRQLVHQQPDYFAFQQKMLASRVRMLSAHAPVRFFRRIFPAHRLITLVRDPVQRTVSHYHTACSKQGFKGSFTQFCEIENNQNVQARYLEQIPPELLGFIGITERYDESVAMFNRVYAAKFNVLSLNTYAGTMPKNSGDDLSDKEMELALDINREDQRLYRTALELFETRLSMQARNLPYVHGKVQRISGQRLEGWAIDTATSNTAVDLDIYCNGNLIARKTAKEYVASMKERNAERDGYVGFIHVFENALKADDQIQVRVSITGQVLRGPVHSTIDTSFEVNQSHEKPPAKVKPQLSIIDNNGHYGTSIGKAANE